MQKNSDNLSNPVKRFPDILDVTPLSSNDDECIAEIRDVLSKHGKLGRFGLTLLHDHFPVSSDETLVEYCNPETRTLTIRPEGAKDFDSSNSIETSWELTTGNVLTVCRGRCRPHPRTGEHIKDHDMDVS